MPPTLSTSRPMIPLSKQKQLAWSDELYLRTEKMRESAWRLIQSYQGLLANPGSLASKLGQNVCDLGEHVARMERMMPPRYTDVPDKEWLAGLRRREARNIEDNRASLERTFTKDG